MPKNECNFAYICATHIHQIDVIFSATGIQRLHNDLKLGQHSQKLTENIAQIKSGILSLTQSTSTWSSV